jgi:hypothetical protein
MHYTMYRLPGINTMVIKESVLSSGLLYIYTFKIILLQRGHVNCHVRNISLLRIVSFR